MLGAIFNMSTGALDQSIKEMSDLEIQKYVDRAIRKNTVFAIVTGAGLSLFIEHEHDMEWLQRNCCFILSPLGVFMALKNASEPVKEANRISFKQLFSNLHFVQQSQVATTRFS